MKEKDQRLIDRANRSTLESHTRLVKAAMDIWGDEALEIIENKTFHKDLKKCLFGETEEERQKAIEDFNELRSLMKKNSLHPCPICLTANPQVQLNGFACCNSCNFMAPAEDWSTLYKQAIDAQKFRKTCNLKESSCTIQNSSVEDLISRVNSWIEQGAFDNLEELEID